MVDPFGLCGEDANDQGEKSKYQWLHNALDWAGLVFDGADIVNGILYAAEGDYVNAAISFACGIPAVGTVIAGVAKMSKAAKAMKTADRIADLCKAAGKVGNTAAGMKANYDTYMQARREGKSVGEAMTYTASKSTTIALTPEQHAATKSVYREWLYERTGKKVGGKVDWTSVSPREIQVLSERIFDAANVPVSARNDYYREFNRYIYGLED